jgi:hypothetical protein
MIPTFACLSCSLQHPFLTELEQTASIWYPVFAYEICDVYKRSQKSENAGFRNHHEDLESTLDFSNDSFPIPRHRLKVDNGTGSWSAEIRCSFSINSKSFQVIPSLIMEYIEL